MLNVDEINHLTTEDFLERYKEIQASIRDQMNDLETLVGLYINDRYLTSTEVAERMRCTIQQIPRDIPCNHIGRNYIYKLSDVEKYLSRTRKARTSL